MNRYQFEDLISDYVENKLTLSKRKDVELYLKSNPKLNPLILLVLGDKLPPVTGSFSVNEIL